MNETKGRAHSSPYLITVQATEWREVAPDSSTAPAVISRRAATTLEEDELALRLFGIKSGTLDTLTDWQADVVNRIMRLPLPAEGGEVTLSDGTTIEVKPTEYKALAAEAGLGNAWSDARISHERVIAAANAYFEAEEARA